MNIKAIRSEAEYRSVLAEIEPLMTAASGSEEGKRLDKLVTLVEEWEGLLGAASEITK